MIFAKCPCCGVDLIEEELLDFSPEGSIMVEKVKGSCKICKREFKWYNIYEYSHFEDLREVS